MKDGKKFSANATIEKWTTIISIIGNVSIFILLVPNLLWTSITYFTTGLETDDYMNFVFPAW